MTKLCVFDLDGTLVNSIYDIAAAMNTSLAQMGKPTYPTDAYYQMVGDGMEMLCRRALTDGTEEEVQTLIELYKEKYLKDCCVLTRPYDGVSEMLKALTEKGILLGIISNKPQDQTNQVVKALLGFEPFFSVIGQSERFPIKPDPTALFYMMQEAKVLKSETWYIGDSNVDMQLGKAAGVRTIGAAWGFRGEEELSQAGGMKIAYCTAEILDIIDEA